jgi:hypothetical protein
MTARKPGPLKSFNRRWFAVLFCSIFRLLELACPARGAPHKPHKNGPFGTLIQNGQKIWCVLAVYSLQLIKKILSEDTNKYLSLSSLLTLHELYTQLLFFWFQLFRSADKIDEDDALVHLELSPHPRHLSVRIFKSLAILSPVPPLPPPSHLE